MAITQSRRNTVHYPGCIRHRLIAEFFYALCCRWTRIFYGTMDEMVGPEDGTPQTVADTSITQDRGLFSWIVATFKIKLVFVDIKSRKINASSNDYWSSASATMTMISVFCFRELLTRSADVMKIWRIKILVLWLGEGFTVTCQTIN